MVKHSPQFLINEEKAITTSSLVGPRREKEYEVERRGIYCWDLRIVRFQTFHAHVSGKNI